MNSRGDFLQFSVESALLKELGERLVGKPQVALAELVKNAYDADASKVEIRIEDSFIEVCDSGDGMTRGEFEKYWMSIGTTHKQRSPLSKRLHRQVTGAKGIGRLSAQFLGAKLTLWTIARSTQSICTFADVDWSQAQTTGNLTKSGAWVKEVASTNVLPNGWRHGTKLRIEHLHHRWDETTLRFLARELWFLRPPTPNLKQISAKEKFDIELKGADELMTAFSKQMDAAFSNWIAEISGKIENGRQKNAKAEVTVTFRDGETLTQQFPLKHRKINEAHFKIRVFKLSGKQQGGIEVKDAREYFRRYGGVHIYDEGFRLPFYGGDQHDWLNLEVDHSHRLIVSKLLPEELQTEGDLRDLPTNSRIFGVVKISTADERKSASADAQRRGDYLNIQLTRDRLIENDALADLVILVRWGIDFYALKQSARRQKEAAKNIRALPQAEPVLDEIKHHVSELKSAELNVPAARKVARIEAKLDELSSIEEQRKRVVSEERALLGALATAGMGALALEHELGKEITALGEALDKLEGCNYSDPEIVDVIQTLRSWIDRSTATRKLFSPLMNAVDREKRAEYRARALLEMIVKNSTPLLRGVSVDVSGIPSDLKLPLGTMSAWQGIFQNVLVNSVNALIDARSKRITCSGGVDKRGYAFIIVEDNGVGVDLDDSDALFKPFERRLEISEERQALGLGGVGLGLTIAKMIAESQGCEVGFVVPTQGMSTAFKISWKGSNDSEGKVSRRHH